MPAVRRGGDIIHEQFIQAIIFIPVCQGEVQRSLNLSTELLRLALSLPTLGHTGAPVSAKRLCEIWVYEWRRLSTTTIVVFQENAPLLRAHAHPARTQTRTERPSTCYWLKAMGAGPAVRASYSAVGRLDSIGRRAIGDMVSSAVASSFEMARTFLKTTG